jgi:hypothetical protein
MVYSRMCEPRLSTSLDYGTPTRWDARQRIHSSAYPGEDQECEFSHDFF